MGNLLKISLNDVLSKKEIPGCVSGVNSLIHIRLGTDHDCDHEICILSKEDMGKTTNSARNAQLNLALLNNGVHSGTRFIMSAFHTEEDIARTAEAFGNALTDVRAEGLI